MCQAQAVDGPAVNPSVYPIHQQICASTLQGLFSHLFIYMHPVSCSDGADGLKAISNHLKTLDFADAPDYDHLRAHLTSMPDGFPPRKHPHTHPNPAQPFAYPQHPSPNAVAVPQAEPTSAPAIHHPSAHPSDGVAAVHYPDAAWPPPEQQQYSYGYGSEGVAAAAWLGYDPNGYASSAATHLWDPPTASARHHHQNWYPPDHVSPCVLTFSCCL